MAGRSTCGRPGAPKQATRLVGTWWRPVLMTSKIDWSCNQLLPWRYVDHLPASEGVAELRIQSAARRAIGGLSPFLRRSCRKLPPYRMTHGTGRVRPGSVQKAPGARSGLLLGFRAVIRAVFVSCGQGTDTRGPCASLAQSDPDALPRFSFSA